MNANCPRQTHPIDTDAPHKSLIAAVVVSFVTALIGTGCEDSLSPAEAVATSGINFRDVESFEARFQITTDGEEPSYTTESEIAYQANEVAYSTMSFEDKLAVLFIPPDLYMRAEDDRWYVLSPWDQGIPRDELPEFGPDRQIIDYGWITDELSDIEQLADETIDGDTYLRYAGAVDLTESSSEAPQDVIGLRPFGIIEGTLDIELWLHEETYLPRKMHVSVGSVGGESNSLTDATFEFFEYDQPITLPDRPEGTRPWRDLDMPEAPCTGAVFAQCLKFQKQLQPIAQDSCQGADKHVCLVPLGQVSPALVQHLVDHYRDQYGLPITVLNPCAVPPDIANPLRGQIDAATLIRYMGSLFMDEYSDPNAVLIGITPVDLYSGESHFRYLFGLKGTPTSPQAVISTFRMNPEAYGGTPDDELLFSRARKLMTKYIGILYYGLLDSDDPESPLYNSILSTADLDDMKEPLAVPGSSQR